MIMSDASNDYRELMFNYLQSEREKNILKMKNDQMKKVLQMWADFWEADGEVDILVGEDAMEATRDLLGI